MRAVINRYQGNSGRFTRISDTESHPPQQQSAGQISPRNSRAGRGKLPFAAIDGIGRLLPEKLGELENEDIILLLILYLMYRESGDSELLIIMGAMFLL